MAEVTLDIPALLALCERLLSYNAAAFWFECCDLKEAHVRLVKGLCETVQRCETCDVDGMYRRPDLGAEWTCTRCGPYRALLAEFAADPQVRMLEEGA